MAKLDSRLAPPSWRPKPGERIGGMKGKRYLEGAYTGRTRSMPSGATLRFIRLDSGAETGIVECRPAAGGCRANSFEADLEAMLDRLLEAFGEPAEALRALTGELAEAKGGAP